jgi:hypothetical protein
MDDKEAIQQAALDYIEGWYQGDTARMERALYDPLVKRRITPEGEVWVVDKEWMVNATRDGRGKLAQPEKGQKEVTLLDKTDRMASIKIVSEKFIDYVHLVKDAGAWKIANVLWDYKG